MNKFTLQEMRQFFKKEFPQANVMGEVIALGELTAELRLEVNQNHLRPGGTISGPSMMALADIALYAAILNEIGTVALAVTTNLNINFIRKPRANCAILAKAKLFKVGKTLAVGEVTLYSEGDEHAVAHATLTYSIPPS